MNLALLPIDPTLLVISIIIVAVAATLQGAIGLGFGQVSAAGLIWTAPDMLPASVILMASIVGFLGMVREVSQVDTRVLSVAMFGRVVGTAIAVPVLVLISDYRQGFSLLFGLLLLLSVVLSLSRIKMSFTSSSLVGGGFISGLTGTITSVGAPPMARVFQNQAVSTARLTRNAFFGIGATFSLLALWYSGRFGLQHMILAAYLAPGFLLGLYLSKRLHKFVDNRFRYLVLAFSSLSAIALIAKSL